MLKRLLILLLLPMVAGAQKHHEVGIFGGTSSYYGDLQQKLFPKEGYRAAGGLTYKYFMHPNVGMRFGVTYASLYGADSTSESPSIKNRNLNFQTNLFEVNGGLEVNMLPVDFDEFKFSPYLFAGLAIFYYNPYTIGPADEKVYLRPLSTEGQGLRQYPDRKIYSLVNVGIPLGAGMKVMIGNTVLISTEIGFRYTATDYLDDVSKTYVNMDTLFRYKGKQSVDLSYRTDELPNWDENYPNDKFVRGDNMKKDWYWFAGINIAIYFESFGNLERYKKTRCPRRVFNK
ncbi:MAG: hypothetical protein IPL09_12705 [Bacteroidetes bacterium]|nr:hypothetical protein [Bacteroidota bacterium]HMT34987.1 DUF6089 family protein [Chitinophagaceae bacterium]MBK6818673.1 hypothetical protein [Bacteroidota bacterium]MBK7040111.1 hypothetical protein [Bacteroidota bacterium]MBK8330300.1 hypothetical protein [Bacteroidota bacterium]